MFRWLLWLGAGTLVGCVPDLPDTVWRVDQPRVLAVTASVTEPKPGQKLTLQAFVATPEGPLAADASLATELRWDACSARLRLDEPGPVSAQCLLDGDHHKPLGNGLSATWTVPADVCRVFGPQPPAPKKGEGAGRPVDADVTGGYYAPLRLTGPLPWLPPELARLRVQCGLAGATQEVAADFARRYLPNTPPALTSLLLRLPTGGALELPLTNDAVPVAVPAGTTLDLTASWAACPALPADAAPAPCGGNEPYLRFDPATRSLVQRSEGRTLSWYVTNGEIALPRTTVLPGVDALQRTNALTTPAAGQTQWLYVVVRDDRGGSEVYAVALRGE